MDASRCEEGISLLVGCTHYTRLEPSFITIITRKLPQKLEACEEKCEIKFLL